MMQPDFCVGGFVLAMGLLYLWFVWLWFRAKLRKQRENLHEQKSLPQRTWRREQRKYAPPTLDQQRSQADGLLATLKQRSHIPDMTLRREQLERELATLHDARSGIPESHQAAGKGMVELQKQIDAIQAQLEQCSQPETNTPLLALLDEAIVRHPDNAALFADRAWHLYEQGQYDKAFADAERALKIVPTYTYALYTRASIHQITGDIRSAIRDYLHCVKLEPRHPKNHARLSECYVSSRDIPRAKVHAVKAWNLSGKAATAAPLLWAICELIEEGSGRTTLQPHYPDPSDYDTIEQKGSQKQELLNAVQRQ